jgi:hypothetical protein
MIFIPPPPTSRQIGRKLGKLLATMRKLQTPVKPQPTTPQHTMSTTTQRPTPETDAAIKKTWPADAISLAVKLERQRDEARAEAERLLVVESQQKDQIEAMREAIKEARAFISRMRPSLLNLEHDDYVARYGISQEYAISEEAVNDALAKLKPFLKP